MPDGFSTFVTADAETIILPFVLLLFATYSLAIWALAKSFAARPGKSVIASAALVCAVSVGALGVVTTQSEWPPESGAVFNLVFWTAPLVCASIALIRAVRSWRRR